MLIHAVIYKKSCLFLQMIILFDKEVFLLLCPVQKEHKLMSAAKVLPMYIFKHGCWLSRIHRRASADDRINVSFPEEFGSISKERGRYRKAMEAGKEPRKGSFASVVMIAAIAVLIVLIGLKAGAGMSGTLDKKETLPAMSTEEDLIPVEKISGEWYTDK